MDIWDNWTAYKHNAFADDVVIYIKRTEHNQHTALRVRKILKAIIFNNRSESKATAINSKWSKSFDERPHRMEIFHRGKLM